MPKTCKELYADRERAWHEAWETYNREIVEAVQREFPIGTKVTFNHGLKEIKAVVVEHGPDWASNKIIVKNAKTGTKWEKEAHELTTDNGQETKEA